MAELKPHRPVTSTTDTLTPKFMSAVIAAVVVSGIYFGKPVLMPLALAVLLSFALAPLVALLKRLRLGHIAPVLISLLLTVVIFSALGTFMGSQLAKLAGELPHYQTNLAGKIHSVVGSAVHNDTITRLDQTLKSLADQVSGVVKTGDDGATSDQIKPIPVVLRRESVAPWAVVQNVLGPLLDPLGLAAIVLVFVGFILLQKDDLRDRFVRLGRIGRHAAHDRGAG